jgi:hypothetical protein
MAYNSGLNPEVHSKTEPILNRWRSVRYVTFGNHTVALGVPLSVANRNSVSLRIGGTR